MKGFLFILLTVLLSGCQAWGQFTDSVFGPNTKNTLKLCDPDTGECTKIVIKGDQSDMASVIGILAKNYGVDIAVESEPVVPPEE